MVGVTLELHFTQTPSSLLTNKIGLHQLASSSELSLGFQALLFTVMLSPALKGHRRVTSLPPSVLSHKLIKGNQLLSFLHFCLKIYLVKSTRVL